MLFEKFPQAPCVAFVTSHSQIIPFNSKERWITTNSLSLSDKKLLQGHTNKVRKIKKMPETKKMAWEPVFWDLKRSLMHFKELSIKCIKTNSTLFSSHSSPNHPSPSREKRTQRTQKPLSPLFRCFWLRYFPLLITCFVPASRLSQNPRSVLRALTAFSTRDELFCFAFSKNKTNTCPA